MELGGQLGAVRLRNFVVSASGTLGYGLEFAHLVHLNRFGGLALKGPSREPMESALAPRFSETHSNMLNAVGLPNSGVRAFVREKLPEWRGFDSTHPASTSGRAEGDPGPNLRAGGIDRTEDALGYLAVGAARVQVLRASYGDQTATEKTVKGVDGLYKTITYIISTSCNDKSEKKALDLKDRCWYNFR